MATLNGRDVDPPSPADPDDMAPSSSASQSLDDKVEQLGDTSRATVRNSSGGGRWFARRPTMAFLHRVTNRLRPDEGPIRLEATSPRVGPSKPGPATCG